MPSDAEICNLAFSHVGVGVEIANLSTDRGQEAAIARRFYEATNKELQRDFKWPFNRRFATLGLVEEDPTSEWAFSYRRPSDCLLERRIITGDRIETEENRIPFIVGSDASGGLIYTDQEDAELEYSVYVDDPELYTPDYVMSLSFRLAAYFGPRLGGGDPFKMTERSFQFFKMSMAKAQLNATIATQKDLPAESEFIRARG